MKLRIYWLSIALLISACTSKSTDPGIELIQDMLVSPAYKSQEAPRVPPEGTNPIGFEPYKFHLNPDGAKGLKNPVGVSESSLARGKKMYETFCFVCHGTQGNGDGPVAAKMPIKVPTLISAKIKGWSDGSIFHVITDGQGIMSTYATQITDVKDRWSIVNYIRQLQKSN